MQNVYDCLYAYGESDQDVADAVSYFQGICGTHAQNNPAIATAATCTSYINATATYAPSQSTTVVIVTATTVVPCTDATGAPIPSSYTTTTTTQNMTVPQVALTTAAVDAQGQPAVGIVPVATYTPVAVNSAVTSNAAQGAAPYATGSAAGSQPSGVAGATGAGSATASATGAVVTAGASRAQVGAGFGAAALAAFALAL